MTAWSMCSLVEGGMACSKTKDLQKTHRHKEARHVRAKPSPSSVPSEFFALGDKRSIQYKGSEIFIGYLSQME